LPRPPLSAREPEHRQLHAAVLSPQADVRLRVVPDDELPALIDESMSLPPIDLTLLASGMPTCNPCAVALPRHSLPRRS